MGNKKLKKWLENNFNHFMKDREAVDLNTDSLEYATKLDFNKVDFLATQIFKMRYDCVVSVSPILLTTVNVARLISLGETVSFLESDSTLKSAFYNCINLEFFKDKIYNLGSIHAPFWDQKISLSGLAKPLLNKEGKEKEIVSFSESEWCKLTLIILQWLDRDIEEK